VSLGDRADAVEAVEVLAETRGEELLLQAAELLGPLPGRKNVLLRVILRHPTLTLTDEAARRLRDAIYAAVHEGDRVDVRFALSAGFIIGCVTSCA
jgi:phenylalanyl-tRNA synthetase alpha chain